MRRDESLYEKALMISKQMYCENKRKPTKLSDDQRLLKLEIANKSKEIPLVARFTSTFTTDSESNNCKEYSIELRTVRKLLTDINTLTKNQYELTRERASKAMVFLFAGKRTRSEVHQCAGFQNGTEEVHKKCQSHGIHIPCQSFDGQWLKQMNKDVKCNMQFSPQNDMEIGRQVTFQWRYKAPKKSSKQDAI